MLKSRPNKRFLPDHYLPSAYSEAVSNLVIAVDASGSVSRAEFTYFVSEIASIQERLRPQKITLIDFDTEIHKIQEITHDTDILREVSFTGRGDTALEPVIEWADKHKPEVMLVFTDGWFHLPNKNPNIPIIWLINNNPGFIANFGEVIHYDI